MRDGERLVVRMRASEELARARNGSFEERLVAARARELTEERRDPGGAVREARHVPLFSRLHGPVETGLGVLRDGEQASAEPESELEVRGTLERARRVQRRGSRCPHRRR
jgi:hypothetical protein